MKNNIINFLRIYGPFLLTIGLWRLSAPFWNPAGILAIIPIFICSFVKPVNWFPLFSVLMCICIDYKFETVCFWLAMYCLFFAINSFQNWIDITRMDKYGIAAFMSFFGLCVLIQVFTNFTFINIARALWIVLWTGALYIPCAKLIQRMQDDR